VARDRNELVVRRARALVRSCLNQLDWSAFATHSSLDSKASRPEFRSDS